MRTRDDIESRVRTLLSEELERRWAGLGERLPDRCLHNYRHPLDTRRTLGGDPNPNYNRVTAESGEATTQTIGLCMYGSADPTQWPGTICEDPIDAVKCSTFCPRTTRAKVLAEFEDQIRDLDWVRENLPEVRALLWVLDEVPEDTRPPWWKRLFWRLFRRMPVKVAPPELNTDITRYLPAHEESDDGIHGT